MKKLRSQKNHFIFTAAILCFCYSCAVNAQETDLAAEKVIEQPAESTPQPPLTDANKASALEPGSATDATDAEEPPQPETGNSTQDANWADLRPYQVNADWVQLKSGEWLRGRIIAMQDFRLEFYSDELKKLTLKWRNVKYIKSSAPYRLRFEDQTIAVGVVEITPEKVHVITDYDEQTFDRNKLLTIASGEETELSLWSFYITLSISLRRGNTDQNDFTSKIQTKRQSAHCRVTIDYL